MRWIAVAALVAAQGCATATTFTGHAKVENGVAGCQAACAAWGMDLAGMVKVGEYSDGCICEVRNRGGAPAARPPSSGPAPEATPAPSVPSSALEAGAGASLAAAGMAVYVETLLMQQSENSAYIPYSPAGSPGWRPGLP
jgi:hypothetical protein